MVVERLAELVRGLGVGEGGGTPLLSCWGSKLLLVSGSSHATPQGLRGAQPGQWVWWSGEGH